MSVTYLKQYLPSAPGCTNPLSFMRLFISELIECVCKILAPVPKSEPVQALKEFAWKKIEKY